MRWLVTGAHGLIGRHLCARLGGEVTGIGHRELPLSDTKGLRRLVARVRPQCIVHLAGALHGASEAELVATNVVGTLSLMQAAAGSGARVVVASSGAVYGAPTALPIRESHACNPVDLYGVTKLAAEHLARIEAARGGLGLVVARIFNVVGPGQGEDHVCGRLAAQLARGPRVIEVGTLDATRDFIDVRDVASALVVLGERGRGTYNVGSGRETPVGEVLAELVRISGVSVDVRTRHDTPRGVGRHVADVSRLSELGFVPAFPLSRSLRDLYADCRQRIRPRFRTPG